MPTRRVLVSPFSAKQQANWPASTWLLLAASLLGLAAFLYPFILPSLLRVIGTPARVPGVEGPLVLAGVAMCCVLLVVTRFASARQLTANPAKTAALLGAVVALDATLRLVPSLGGATSIFLLIILVGAVFGAELGFLTGALTLLLSAFLTGGVGPWLPFQMLGAGWVGLGAAWLPRGHRGYPHLVSLILYGIGSGFLYGALLSLYSWPFASPGLAESSTLFWHPGLGLGDTIHRYASFYLVTSFSHDALRAIGNGLLLLALGPPLVRTLERGRRRLSWRQPQGPSRAARSPAAGIRRGPH